MARTLKVLVPVAGSSEYKAVASASAKVNDTGLSPGKTYLFTCDIACYIKQGSSPTAAASDGSMMVPAYTPVLLHGSQGADVAAIRIGSNDGVCTIQEMTTVTP